MLIDSGWSLDCRRRASATTDTRSKISVSDFLSRSIPDSSRLMLSRFSTIAFSLSVAVSVSARSRPLASGSSAVAASISAVMEPLIAVSGVRSSWETVLRSTLPSRSDSRAMRFLRFSSDRSSRSMERARVLPSIWRESSWSFSQRLSLLPG